MPMKRTIWEYPQKNRSKSSSLKLPDPHKHYIRNFLLVVVAVCMVFQTIPAIGIDPYKVFGISDFNQKNFAPNTRYLKIEHLQDTDAYKGFIFGTSRANFYNVESARKLSGLTYYNMNGEGDNSVGLRRKVEWVVENEPIQQAIVALDYDFGYGKINPLELFRQDHPDVSGIFPPQFYGKYLLFQPNTLYECIQENLKEDTYYLFHVDTGHFWNQRYIQLNQGEDRYVGNQFRALNDWEKPNPIVKNVDALAEYRQAIAALDQKNIDRTVAINPINQVRYTAFDIDDYIRWYREVVEMAGQVWDFSGLNPVTTNDRNYYDTSHFTKEIGDVVLTKIWQNRDRTPSASNNPLKVSIPNDFGVLVTPENVEERVQQLYRQYRSYRPKPQPAYDP